MSSNAELCRESAVHDTTKPKTRVGQDLLAHTLTDKTYKVASLKVLPVGQYYWQVDLVLEMVAYPGILCKEIASKAEIQATHEF